MATKIKPSNLDFTTLNIAVSNTGNVGIGNTAPAYKLHVTGDTFLGTGNTYITNANTMLSGGFAGGHLRITTPFGYTEIGPRNASWSHFETDRAAFYFGTQAVLNNGAGGTVSSYSGDPLILGASSFAKTMTMDVDGDLHIPDRLYLENDTLLIQNLTADNTTFTLNGNTVLSIYDNKDVVMGNSLYVEGTGDGTGVQLYLRNTTNGGTAAIEFSDTTDWLQTGKIDFTHFDTASYGTGASFKFSSSETELTVGVDGHLVVGRGVSSGGDYSSYIANFVSPVDDISKSGVFIDMNSWTNNSTVYGMYIDIDLTAEDNLTAARSKYGQRIDISTYVPANANTTLDYFVYGTQVTAVLADNAANTSYNSGQGEVAAGVFQGYTNTDQGANLVTGVLAAAYVQPNTGNTVNTVATARAIYAVQQNNSFSTTINDAFGVYAHINQDDTGGTTTTATGVYSRMDRDAGTAVDGYAFRGAFEGTWTGVRFGVYVSGEANNYFSSNMTVGGALTKASGSFRIPHPHPDKTETHDLVHSFVEAPGADNLYSGMITLVNGSAQVNLDEVSGMTEGTFLLLNRNLRRFVSNEGGWTAVRSRIEGNVLIIEAQDPACTDEVFWMVIGERHDKHMYDTGWTDETGKVIVEPLKAIVEPMPQYDDFESDNP